MTIKRTLRDVVLAGLLASGLAACSDKSFVSTVDGEVIKESGTLIDMPSAVAEANAQSTILGNNNAGDGNALSYVLTVKTDSGNYIFSVTNDNQDIDWHVGWDPASKTKSALAEAIHVGDTIRFANEYLHDDGMVTIADYKYIGKDHVGAVPANLIEVLSQH